MKDETVMIILPLPPAVLSPNRPCGSIGGRMRRAAVAKKFRRLAREAVAAQEITSGPWEKATAQACFYHATNRRRDGANYNAMLKPVFDGIVDAGLVVDDDHRHWTTLPPTFYADRGSPRVEIWVRRQESEGI